MSTNKNIYSYEYPRPSVTADTVVFGHKEKEGLSVLLIKRGNDPFKGQWALPGGYMEMNETARQCAERELLEETGIDLSANTLFKEIGCFSDIDRDPRGRVVSIAFYTMIEVCPVGASDDAADASWFTLDKLPQLAFDHDKIIESAIKMLKRQSTASL